MKEFTRTAASRSLYILVLFSLMACSSISSTGLAPTSTPFMPAAVTATPQATELPTPTSGPPLPLPEPFTSDLLLPGIEPVAYIANNCSYLQHRWDPVGSLPGTVVAPIMFHSILKDGNTNDDPSAINFVYFQEIVREAERLGFETITSDELLRFLRENAKIPPRSMILILDDRRPGTAEDYFLPVNKKHQWTTTLAWLNGDTDQRPGDPDVAGDTLWDWIERINDTGYFDIQAHGLNHIPIRADTPEETVRSEIFGIIPIFEDHFGHRPIAYIWPGGNYTPQAVQVAHEAEYELGFTIWSRGPLQFNWIPQGEDERSYNDPLMLMPRFWDTAAVYNLDQTAEIGNAAQEFAKESYVAEAGWYSQNCGGVLPPLEEVFK